MTQLTARAQVAAWVREQTAGNESVDLPALVDEAIGRFRGDDLFMTTFMREQFRETIYTVARQVLISGRGMLAMGDEVVTKEALEKKSARLLKRWENWLEHAGSRYVPLLEMRRADLTLAVHERRQRAQTEVEIADFLEAIAKRLKGDERVRDRFTGDQLDLIRRSMQRKGGVA